MNRAHHKDNLNRSLETCLLNVSNDHLVDSQITQRLGNIIQGKFLDHLVDYIARYHDIQDKNQIAKLTVALMQIMSRRFCSEFRKRVEADSSILLDIAKKISASENHQRSNARVECLYLWICKKYFGFEDIGYLVKWIETKPCVQSILFISRILKTDLPTPIKSKLSKISSSDPDAILAIMCTRYLDENRLTRLKQIFEGDQWEIEFNLIQNQLNQRVFQVV